MKNIRAGHTKPMFVFGLTTFGAAAVGAGMVGGLWFGAAEGRGWQALLASAVLAVTAVLWVVRQSRDRAARRLQYALDAYAEREITRVRPRPTRAGIQGSSRRPDRDGSTNPTD